MNVMKKLIICIGSLLFFIQSQAQIITDCEGSSTISSDKSHNWRVTKIELYEDKVYVSIEVTALKLIKRLNICNNNSHIIFSSKNDGIGLKGVIINNEVKELSSRHNWGWNNLKWGEKAYYTLCFGGGGNNGYSIPPSVTYISIYEIGIEADGKTTTWQSTNLKINNPRKHYTNFSSEYSIKQYLDANNDGICGIYEVIGDTIGSKYACLKNNGDYALIFMSDNLERSWWKMGDIKAYLHRSASGIMKADWLMSDKRLNKDCYITFDGFSMTVTHVSGPDPGEKKYLKMYPTDPPSYDSNYQREYTPQRQQQVPQRKQTIPVLKKQNTKAI